MMKDGVKVIVLTLAVAFGAAVGIFCQSLYIVTQKDTSPVVIAEIVKRDGVVISGPTAETIKAAAKSGDASYEFLQFVEGESPIAKSVVIGGDKPPVPVPPKPVDPKPVDPQPDVKPVEPVTTKPTAAIYFYEKDQTAIPSYVSAGLNQINRKGIDATLFEVDTKAGSGQIPERFRVPHSEAVKAGVPVLIVMSGTTVSKVIKAPKSLEEITGAVQ